MKCCIATLSVGVVSEVWMWRQIVGMKDLSPRVLTWEYMNRDAYPLDGIPFKVLQRATLPMKNSHWARWAYRLRRLKDLNYYACVGSERREISRYLRNEKPDVILAHFGPAALRIWPAAKELGIPLVAHFHGFDISSSLGNRRYRWSLARHAESFAAIIVVGTHQRQWFYDQGISKDKIYIIPCGVPTDEFNPPERRYEDRINFITVSRLKRQKGLHHTINAFYELFKDIQNIYLTIIGDGPESFPLKDQVKKMGIANKVEFMGNQPPYEVKRKLAASHVYIQHSMDYKGWVEGFGVSLAEAAAMELPIVSTYCGGIPDQVVPDETGFLVNQHDVHGMARYMLQLAESEPLRFRMGQAGRRRMQQHFDTPKQINKLEDVLLDSIQSHRPRRATL